MAPVDTERVRGFLRDLDGLRRERGLSWQRLAGRSGLAASTLHAWMSPQRSRLPGWDEVRRVVAACGADEPEWLGRWRAAGRTPAPEPAQAPAQLPLPAPLTGRDAELIELDRLAGHGRPVVVSGTAGVGKTALAVSWAHRVRAAFPDGQLYLDLRGYGPESPVRPTDALAGFLHALGVTGAALPLDLAGRAGALRTALAGRRMLVLLDNAGSVEQVRPLLPGTAGTLVLVTSRDALAGLVAREAAQRVELDLLSTEQSVELLRGQLGARVDAEPAAAATLAQRCARLPLALRIAAELATARPRTPLADLADELASHRSRLALLDAGGDPYTAVRSVFSWSCTRLPDRVLRLFGLLGVHPGHDIDAHAAAALAGVPVAEVRADLAVLTRAHLVRPCGRDRFDLHDLLRAYAAEQAAGHDPESAFTALAEHYLATAVAAMAVLHPVGLDELPAAPHAPTAPVPDVAAALRWLDDERANLVELVAHGVQQDQPQLTVRLAATIAHYLGRGHFAEAIPVHRHAIRAAVRTGDRAAQAAAEDKLAKAFYQLGRHDDAITHLTAARELYRSIDDRRGETSVLVMLGAVHRWVGDMASGLRCQRQALRLSRKLGDQRTESSALTNLASLYTHLGRYPEAFEHYRQALALVEANGDRLAAANVLEHLSTVHRLLERPFEAVDCATRALDVCRELGERFGEAYTLNTLASAVRVVGDHERAERLHRDAIEIAEDIGERFAQAVGVAGIGTIHADAGRHDLAIEHHRRALVTFRDVDVPQSQSASLSALGGSLAAKGLIEQARSHFAEALAAATAAGTHREQVVARTGLDTLPEPHRRGP